MESKTLLRLAEGTVLMAGIELNAKSSRGACVVSESGREVKVRGRS